MTLMTRLSRLFKADVNAILDNLEEPEQMLKQALRDMETALDSEQKQLKILNLNLIQFELNLKNNKSLMTKLQAELQLCINANNESLAKNLIRKKLMLQGNLETISQKMEKFHADKKTHQKTISEMQQTISEVSQKVEIISTQKNHKQPHSLFSNQQTITTEDVEIEWLRLQNTTTESNTKRKAS
jgi:phage shock protein A